MIKIKAKPGDILVLLVYDLMAFSGWRPMDETYVDKDMQCKTVGTFKSLNKESVVLYQMGLVDIDDDKRKEAWRLNAISIIPLGAIKGYKNLGRVLDWPKSKKES